MSDTPHPWLGIRPWQRHGQVLMVAGFVFIGIGSSYAFAEPTANRKLALQIVLEWSHIGFWGGLFMFAGALTILSSRWPPISKTWGYFVLSSLSAFWALVYLAGIAIPWVGNQVSWLANDLPQAPISGFSAVALWGLISFMWVAISGLINADDIHKRPMIVEDDGLIIDPQELI